MSDEAPLCEQPQHAQPVKMAYRPDLCGWYCDSCKQLSPQHTDYRRRQQAGGRAVAPVAPAAKGPGYVVRSDDLVRDLALLVQGVMRTPMSQMHETALMSVLRLTGTFDLHSSMRAEEIEARLRRGLAAAAVSAPS